MTPTPLTLLRSTGPHAGLDALSAELWAAWQALPKAERLALTCRDGRPGLAEIDVERAVWRELFLRRDRKADRLPDFRRIAREAVAATRGILDPDGRVTR